MILAIIQARMGSSRLPGKVLMELSGKPVLLHVVNRVKNSKLVSKVVVATTTSIADKQVIDICIQNGIDCFAGSESDVLDRYYQTAINYKARLGDAVVRITADCPLIDPEVIDNVISLFMESGTDYVTNTLPPTFPDGLDVEVFEFTALEKAWKEANLLSEREHVTPFIRNHPELFSRINFSNNTDLSSLRWTLDEIEDYRFLSDIYCNLYSEDRIFLMADVLDFIENNPNIKNINCKFKRNEGYEESLRNDRIAYN